MREGERETSLNLAIVVSVVSVALKVAAKQQTIHKQLKAKGVKITWKTPSSVADTRIRYKQIRLIDSSVGSTSNFIFSRIFIHVSRCALCAHQFHSHFASDQIKTARKNENNKQFVYIEKLCNKML